jgi:hypothetical protein
MNKSSLSNELDLLRKKSQDVISQISEHERIAKLLREDALIIKGEYQAIERLLTNLPEDIKKAKVPNAKNSTK